MSDATIAPFVMTNALKSSRNVLCSPGVFAKNGSRNGSHVEKSVRSNSLP